jgi:hypothetical protein
VEFVDDIGHVHDILRVLPIIHVRDHAGTVKDKHAGPIKLIILVEDLIQLQHAAIRVAQDMKGQAMFSSQIPVKHLASGGDCDNIGAMISYALIAILQIIKKLASVGVIDRPYEDQDQALAANKVMQGHILAVLVL